MTSDDSERLPWCSECEAISVPTDDGTCGECGTEVDFREGRTRKEPTINDDGTVTLHGVGPKCPGCGGPTHAVTADEDAERPWWCKRCNVRLDDEGNAGGQANFPSGADPDVEDGGEE